MQNYKWQIDDTIGFYFLLRLTLMFRFPHIWICNLYIFNWISPLSFLSCEKLQVKSLRTKKVIFKKKKKSHLDSFEDVFLFLNIVWRVCPNTIEEVPTKVLHLRVALLSHSVQFIKPAPCGVQDWRLYAALLSCDAFTLTLTVFWIIILQQDEPEPHQPACLPLYLPFSLTILTAVCRTTSCWTGLS